MMTFKIKSIDVLRKTGKRFAFISAFFGDALWRLAVESLVN